jgi:solute carrier family 25 carnitine/acylcarnitine transporter 20/29
MRRRLLRQNQLSNPTASKLSYTQYYLAGAYAGIGNSILSGPIEHIRIKLQTQPSGQKRLYTGPGDCIRKIYAVDGVKGIYRAQVPTMLREAQGFGLWFLTFEFLVQWSVTATGGKRDDLPAWKLCGFGAIAGLVLWIGSYPLDVIKSRMQSDVGYTNKVPETMKDFKDKLKEVGEGRRYSSMMDCSRKIFRESGVSGFWRGLAPTLVRAIPCSAGTFAAYVPLISLAYLNSVELTMRLLG